MEEERQVHLLQGSTGVKIVFTEEKKNVNGTRKNIKKCMPRTKNSKFRDMLKKKILE